MPVRILLLLMLCHLFQSCGSKPDQTQNDITTADSVQAVPAPAEDDSSKTYALKWKAVSSSEFGNWYEFTDQDGQDFHAHRLLIDEFSEDDNEYFTRTPVEGTPFSQYEIKDAVKEKWFDVKVVTQQEENENAGDGSMKEVLIIVGIKPH